MDSQTLERLVEWLGAHPIAAGGVIFLIAFCDAIVILGIAVPALPILFAVGTLVGLGHIDGTYAVVCASLGAFCGDGVSYLFGRHYGWRLKRMWPFSRHPEWLESGEQFFARHGLKGIVIARFVGAVRPFVPAIAGMLRMRLSRYVPASAAASAAWGVVFIVPGWLFGASLELLAAIAGRLAIVLGLLLVVLALIHVATVALYRVLAPRTAAMMERALAWSHRHPVLGRMTEALIDPRRRESTSLALLAALLIMAGWAFFTVLVAVVGNGEALPMDLAVHHAMFALRTPLADHLLASLSGFGDWQVLLPASVAVFAWLLWRRRHSAAWHWAAAISFGLALVAALGFLLDMPKPPAATAVAGFGFPSAPVTMATVVYGFFAVLIARELPGRRRAWPYAVAGLLVALVAFSSLYFGAHWLSDVLAGVLLGMVWIAALGIAYRRRVSRSFWVRPVATLFFAAVLGLGAWHGARSAGDTLARFEAPLVPEAVDAEDWWRRDWARLPTRRNEFASDGAWPLNLQFAGDLARLRGALEHNAWVRQQGSGWTGLLQSLDADATPATLPVLPASHNGRPEALLMTRAAPAPQERYVLRLWPAPLQLEPGATPVWQGMVTRVRFEQRFDIFSLWLLGDDHAAAQQRLAQDVGAMDLRLVPKPDVPGDVLLLRAPAR